MRRLLQKVLLLGWLPCAALAGVYEQGLEAKKAGRHEEAAELLAEATAAQPRNVEAWFHYGTVLGWLKRHDEALTAVRRGLKLAPKDFDLRMAEARLLVWKSDYAAAEARLAGLEKEFPGNVDVVVMRGRVAVWLGNTEEGRRRYEAVLQQDPNQVDALTGLGDLEAEARRTAEARSLYQRALAVDPSPDIQLRLDGLRQEMRGRVDMGMGGSTFDRRPRDDWWNVYAGYTHRFRGWDAWLKLETGERFGLQDVTWDVGVAGAILPAIRMTVFGGITPDASFSADWYLDGSLRWRLYEHLGLLGQGWLLTEARRAEYAVEGLWVTRLGWEQDLGRGWTLNARWLHFFYDEGLEANGWTAFLAWEPKERWYLRLGAGQAVESLTNQTLLPDRTLKSWTLFAGIVVPVSKRWHVRLDFEREEVESSVIRYGLSAGCGYVF